MKRTLLCLAILICLFVNTGKVLANEQQKSLNTELTWNFSKNLFQNLLTTENLHTGYSIAAYGIEKLSRLKIVGRTGEIILAFPFATGLSVLNHEGGHEWIAVENGALETWIEWSPKQFWTGKAWYVGRFSKEQKVKFAAAGLTRQNQAAVNVIDRNLGETITVFELIWFWENQLSVPIYIISANKLHENNYGIGTHDIESWIANMADGANIRNSLYDDLRIGTVWQNLGAVVPTFTILRYWLLGKKFRMPSWWLNPQTELTDAGVMYALGIWYQFNNDIMLKIRPAWGKGRIQNDALIALETEVIGISLPFWGTQGKIRGGFSKTLKTSTLIGISVEKPFTGKIAIGIDANYYSGYHRNNPRATKSYGETIIKFKLFF